MPERRWALGPVMTMKARKYNVSMQTLRRSVASAVALSLVLLSPGSHAWAQFSRAAARPAQVPAASAGSAAAVRLGGSAALSSMALVPAASLSAALAAPSAAVPAAALAAAPLAAAP